MTPPYYEQIYRRAAEYVVLRYSAYFRYVLLQLRNLLFFVSAGFFFLALALNSYPFEGTRSIARFVLIEFLALAAVVYFTLADIERNPVLSLLEGSTPGSAATSNFVLRLTTYLALPLFGLLTVQFPSIGRFISSWVAPAIEAMK